MASTFGSNSWKLFFWGSLSIGSDFLTVTVTPMFLKQDANQSNKWTTLTPLQVDYPRWNPVSIREIDLDLEVGWDDRSGLWIKHNQTNCIVSKGFWTAKSICLRIGYTCNVIVDGKNGKLIEFDPKNKKYKAPVAIPQLGEHTSSIMINGHAHMIHGGNNSTNQYVIYSIKTGKVTEFQHNLKRRSMSNFSITQTGDGQFIKSGGWDLDEYEWVDSLYAGTVHDEQWMNSNIFLPLKSALDKLVVSKGSEYDEGISRVIVDYVYSVGQDPISWRRMPHWRLNTPLQRCGVIRKYPFVIVWCDLYFGRSVGKWTDPERDEVSDEESVCRGVGLST